MWWRRDNEEEDPFASLRGEAGATTSTRTSVADHTTVSGVPGAEDEPATQRRPGSRAPKRRRGSDRLLVLLLIVGSLGASAALIVREQDAAPDGPRAEADPVPGGDPADPTPAQPGGGARPGADEPPPRRRYDLVQPQGMRLALRALRRTMGPREVLDSLRVEPGRIDAIVHSPQSERQRMIDVADDLTVDVTNSGQRAGRGMRLAQVDPTAPSRAVRAAAGAGNFRVGKLDYMVLTAPIIAGYRPSWSLFFDGVRIRNQHWNASLDGRVVNRPGEQPGGGSSTTTLTIVNNGRRTVLRGEAARRVSDCVRRARERNGDISACLP